MSLKHVIDENCQFLLLRKTLITLEFSGSVLFQPENGAI